MTSLPPIITLEEHFAAADLVGFGVPQLQQWGDQIAEKLTSLSDTRLRDMDAGKVTRQLLSHVPFRKAPSPEICKTINDHLHAAIAKHPERLVGFACLPMLHPAEAATELRRTVTELGFVGALVDNHTDGKFYDEEKFDPVWEEAVRLDVPIYLHPSFASDTMVEVNYRGNYPEGIEKQLANHVFGWHTETGLHFLRLFAAGLFDRFPTLKIILGHMGELIPFMLDRQSRQTAAWKHIKRPIKEVWRSNIWVTTSGMFDTAPLECLLSKSPLDHVLFSVDYPFSPNEMGAEFIAEVERKGVLKGEELRMFASGNAEKLLRIKV